MRFENVRWPQVYGTETRTCVISWTSYLSSINEDSSHGFSESDINNIGGQFIDKIGMVLGAAGCPRQLCLLKMTACDESFIKACTAATCPMTAPILLVVPPVKCLIRSWGWFRHRRWNACVPVDWQLAHHDVASGLRYELIADHWVVVVGLCWKSS